MIVFLNGEFVPEEKAVVSVFDRGFLFGDGLFEAMLVRRGEIFRWDQHIERLPARRRFSKVDSPLFDGRTFPVFHAIDPTEPDAGMLAAPEHFPRHHRPRLFPEKRVHPAIVLTLHPAPVLDDKGPCRAGASSRPPIACRPTIR
jgi:hypothetical protein